MARLEVIDLSRSYPDEVVALQDASFVVEDGRVAALLGPSGCGKTTLAERLVRTLGERGYRVGVVKSARHHDAPADRTGADTARAASAGAVAVAGAFADGVVIRLPRASLALLLETLAPSCDLVLVEGFHDAPLPALAFDGGAGRDVSPADATIARIHGQTTTVPWPVGPATVPYFHRDEIAAIADYLAQVLLGAPLDATAVAGQALRPRRNVDATERSRAVHLRAIRA